MSIETKTSLNAETLNALQDLIQINLDSEKGFAEAAEKVKDQRLSVLFGRLGQERGEQATELQHYVEMNSDREPVEGSYLAAFHRAWLSLRGKLAGGSAHVILVEAERGEDQIKHAYEDALRATAGSAMNDVLTRQYAAVKSGHDQVRDLRDATA